RILDHELLARRPRVTRRRALHSEHRDERPAARAARPRRRITRFREQVEQRGLECERERAGAAEEEESARGSVHPEGFGFGRRGSEVVDALRCHGQVECLQRLAAQRHPDSVPRWNNAAKGTAVLPMVERRRVVHDRRRLLLEAGHPMSSRVLIASLASLLVACGDEIATPTAGADARRYTLALIGDPAITLHPGEVRTLQALLAASEDGPVASARIHFAFLDGNPAGARIDAGDVVTDDEGVATVRLTAGSTPAAFH